MGSVGSARFGSAEGLIWENQNRDFKYTEPHLHPQATRSEAFSIIIMKFSGRSLVECSPFSPYFPDQTTLKWEDLPLQLRTSWS